MSRPNSAFSAQARSGVRNLANLEQTASTTRVLNLVAVSREWAETWDYMDRPLFRSRLLNTSLFVKHRLRDDEIYLVSSPSRTTTKIIFPLHRDQFSLGGQSILIGQNGWREGLMDVCGGEDGADFVRDVRVLEIMNELPSFDPFLLREHLRRRKVDVAPCYFAISQADVERMRGFVAEEVATLISLAFGDLEVNDGGRLVDTLLSSRVDEKLEPLRITFGLDPDSFREGVFSWRGFLYYKWCLADLTARVNTVMDEIAALKVLPPCSRDSRDYVGKAQARIRRAVAHNYRKVAAAIAVYDDAFHDLTRNGEPKAFRAFLVRAPSMFLSLGEMVGAMSHIASFWRYRYPQGARLEADGPDAHDLLRDFELSLGVHAEETSAAA
jgi:hypothetical protein